MEKVAEYKIKDKNQILKIYQDESPESPNDWGDDEVFLVYEHRQFQVDREGFKCREIFDFLNYPEKPVVGNAYTEDEIEERIQEWEDNKGIDYSEYHIFGVDAYIHSGVALSLADKTNFPDRRWDVSTTGFILVKKDILKGSSKHEEDLSEEEAEKYAEGLIETWNQYLSGDVYGFKLFNIKYSYKFQLNDLIEIETSSESVLTKELMNISEQIEELEESNSCWGFYGDDYENIFDDIGLKLEDLEEIK